MRTPLPAVGRCIHPFFEHSTPELEPSTDISRQVQTEKRRRKFARRRLPASNALTRGQRHKAREEQEDTPRGRRTEPARLYPQRAPDSRRLTQAKHERNQAELPMRLGVDSREWTVTHKVTGKTQGQACKNSGENASSESSERVPCGKRCRRCSTLKQKQTHPVCRRESRHLAIQRIQNVVFFGHHFVHSLGCVQRCHVARLAPSQSSGKSREKVGERAGRLPRVWKPK